MSAAVTGELRQRKAAFERAEQTRVKAAGAEHAAFTRWQEAYGAYEVARDEASTAGTAWGDAVIP